MPSYRLVFTSEPAEEIGSSVCFTADNASEALILAQRHDSPAELWQDDRHLCTLSRSGNEGEFWIIS